MKRLSTLSLIFVALVLVGCQVTPGPGNGNGTGPFPDAIARDVSTSEQPLDNATVRAGQPVVYQVFIPRSVAAASDLIYYEVAPQTGGAVPNVRISLHDSNGQETHASISNRWFSRANLVPLMLEEEWDPQSIQTGPRCGGPCVVLRAPELPATAVGGTVYVRVASRSGSQPFTLYSFGKDYEDPNEPNNNTRQQAVVLTSDEDYRGAIEVVADEDWYRSSGNVVNVSLSSGAEALDIRAEIYRQGQTLPFTEIRAGETATLPQGEPAQFLFARVYSATGRAAAEGDGLYTINMTIPAIVLSE